LDSSQIHRYASKHRIGSSPPWFAGDWRKFVKRLVLLFTVSMVVAAVLVFAGPASAQGGCKAFGQNIAPLATTLGSVFGQTASGSAPLNDTVEQDQQALCAP
jgi:hypothetical protein